MAPGNLDRESDDELVKGVRRRLHRHQVARGREPSVIRHLAQIGVLGWLVVAPTLCGFFGGRWLDHRFGSGMVWSLGLLAGGLGLGCWWAWKWIKEA